MRSESPQPGAGRRSASVDSATASPHDQTSIMYERNNEPVENPFATTSESSAESEDRIHWKTIKKRSSKSRKTTKAKHKKVSQPEPDLVREAEKQLTIEERQCIYSRKRAKVGARVDKQTSSSHDEGPSKGKGTDPRNWGDVDLEESELGPEAQRDVLATWARSRAWANEQTGQQTESDSELHGPTVMVPTERQMILYYEQKIHLLEERLKKAERPTRPSKNNPKVRIAQRPTDHHPVREMVKKAAGRPSNEPGRRETPPAMDAAAQIAPKSYLGRAFEKMNERGKGIKPGHPEDDSSGTSSELSTESSSENEDSSLSSSNDAAGKSRKASKKRRKNKKHKSKKKSTLKLIPPREYDGSVDLRAFHRFVTEGTTYVEDGSVPRKRQVFVLSHYLKGKAHDFYLRQVSDQLGKWRIREFFTEMFNYCFPLDFQMKQRKKLYRCYQGDKEKVVKFWFGLNDSIQNELYKMHLNPEVSTLQEVQHMAKIIELAESATTIGRSRDEGPKPTKKGAKDSKGHLSHQTGEDETHQGSSKDGQRSKDKSSSGSTRRDRGQKPVQGKRPEHPKEDKMSREEHNKLMSEGRCFVCKETGHMSRQCPKRTNVPSGRRDKPPGVPNYAVHIDTQNDPRKLEDCTELISEIPLCGISLGVSDANHVIMDRGSHLEDDIEIPSTLLANPAFFVSDWYARRLSIGLNIPKSLWRCMQQRRQMGNAIRNCVLSLLNAEPRFPGEPGKDRFRVQRVQQEEGVVYEIFDRKLKFCVNASESFLRNEKLNMTHWYARSLLKGYRRLNALMLSKELEWEDYHLRLLDTGELSSMDRALESVIHQLFVIPDMRFKETPRHYHLVELNGQQVAAGRYPAIQRNSAVTRDFRRLIPKPVVVVAHINGCLVKALIDTGSLADFMSTTLADQLCIKHIPLDKPLTIQLAVQGSRSKVNFGATAQFAYQHVKEERSSPTVPFWFGLAEPFRTVIDFDCDNFGLHVKLLSSGFALLVNQATFSLFEESCVVKARIILMEASAPEQTTAQPITRHATVPMLIYVPRNGACRNVSAPYVQLSTRAIRFCIYFPFLHDDEFVVQHTSSLLF
ncbi:uncharacterized protein EDB93DRAFT_1101114 [Suillus bovinus]|uniref:uncharacterized protein n=1 Tax=Suillus bovinus TaxID=48563 RepID=UPI001B880574|nr:uncharacterized protein EDB93DRAFT_1101114 [Suillus bovinus]KAG2157806.1 hypothetical protein EDB93DRAFT_1101114 [Suillus bovinus]